MSNWNKPLITKQWKPEKLVKEAIDRHEGHIYVAFSGGKSSLVVTHMAIQENPDIPIVYANTGVQYPETIKFVHDLKDEWNLNLIEAKPETTFWILKNQHGLPNYKASKKRKRPRCCYHLKEKPARKIEIKKGFTAVFTGIQGSESYYRRRLMMFCGQRYILKATGIWRYHPIMHWNDNQVWQYIHENSLPVNPIYKKYDATRTGCITCTAHKGWEERLKRESPQLLKMFRKDMNLNR